MDKISTDNSSSPFDVSPEARTLRDVVHSSKNTGRNYGSLAKSQIQPIFYISHHVELDDTLQRLALKYSINVSLILEKSSSIYQYFFLSKRFKKSNELIKSGQTLNYVYANQFTFQSMLLN